MNPRRVAVLFGKEVLHGPKNFVFIFALVVPLVLSLVMSLLFGTLFSGRPRLGIADEGHSQLPRLAAGLDSLILKQYATATELRQAVERGAVDLGIALPPGFDERLQQGDPAGLAAYIWGQSLLKNRAVLGTTFVVLVRQIAGQETPVEIVPETLGDADSTPWEQRLLPLVVLMAVVLGGSMVPATSLVNEKQKRTLGAVVVTPASLADVFFAKVLVGAILGLLTGTLTLAINRAWGAQPALLLLVLALGAILAAVFGILLGAFVKDVNSLFATLKAIGILLYAPAFLYLFPEIPEWIGRIFPTYYLIAPVVEITQRGGTWADVAWQLAVLVVLIAALIGATALVAGKMRLQEA
jgi:ABC-2 type transport system permease protein